MKLIDKSAVKAEIERMLQNEYPCDNSEQETGYGCALYELQDFLDTLEVKDMDTIEREIKEDAGGYPYIDATELYDYENDKPLAKAGDKVKVLIVKDK